MILARACAPVSLPAVETVRPSLLAGPAADVVDVVVLRLDRAATPPQRRAEAGRLLRQVLAGYLGAAPGEIEVVRGPHGKPELADRAVRFNLSHSNDLAVVAVTRDRAVGVDVERTDARRDVAALAPRALGADEAEMVLALPSSEQRDAFHRAWARREAVAKCAGTGLAAPPPDAPRQVVDLDVGPGYAAALAVEGAAPVRVELRA